MREKIRIGILGCGQFSASFVELFQKHPYVERVVVADTEEENAKAFGERFGVEYYRSLDELLQTDINAVAIFTPRHTHGPLVVQALEAGRHVYSAVPMASEISHCEQIVRLVEKTGLTYMMGETCIYYPCSMFCKERFESGEMGKFVYAESQYHHDISHFSEKHRSDLAAMGVPPFFYPTHSLSMVLAATGSHVTKVSAFGYEDTEDDPIFKKGVNLWDNTISNAFSLMTLENGGVIRINECRRIGYKAPSSYISAFYGTKASYQFSNAQHVYTQLTEGGVSLGDVSDYVNPAEMTAHKNDPDFKERVANHTWQWNSFAPIQNPDVLPESYKDLPNGHMASHQFLINDFCTAVYEGTLPTVNAWLAARYTVPGLVAYESIKQGGAVLEVPDFGDPPKANPLPQLLMRNPDIENLPPLDLPAGVTLQTHKEGEEKEWEELIKSAFGHPFSFDFLRTRGDYAPDHVLYLSKNGKKLATATAVENEAYPGEGWFRMVGVHKDARGEGMGKLIALAALHALRERGFKSALLSTDDARIPAIRLYLSLGFRPIFTHESHERRWNAVMKKIEAQKNQK
jgi:predicted dehydrogenase/GNAT superfamily N-acetyltransferase